jgi:hypothetical protein
MFIPLRQPSRQQQTKQGKPTISHWQRDPLAPREVVLNRVAAHGSKGPSGTATLVYHLEHLELQRRRQYTYPDDSMTAGDRPHWSKVTCADKAKAKNFKRHITPHDGYRQRLLPMLRNER